MIPHADRRDSYAGWMFALSFSLHLMFLLICSNTNLFRPALHEATPYYVDIVSLPAIDASSSEPSVQQPAPPAASPSPPAPPRAAAAPAMTIPVKPAQKQPPAATPLGAADQEAKDFAERMNRLEHRSEAKHQAAALESLQKRVTAPKTPSASGGATGKNIGADYGAYIQSRLKDALESTLVYRSQNPEAAVHLYIDKRGKLIKVVMLRPSPDKLFNESVMRSIEKAKANFPPNPSGAGFDKLFVFSPLEVSK